MLILSKLSAFKSRGRPAHIELGSAAAKCCNARDKLKGGGIFMLDYLVLAFSILYIPLLPFAVVAGGILFFRGAARRKKRELLRRYNIPPPEYLNPSTSQMEGFPYEGEREAAKPSGAQPEPAWLTPNEEGYADAHRDPENLQPSPAVLAEQLVRLLDEHPELLEKPRVHELLLAVSEAAVEEFRSLGQTPGSADDPAYV